MQSTSPSLLEQLRRPDQQLAWERFVRVYTPILCHWARRLGLQDHDVADLVQDVMVRLHQKLPEFAYNPSKSFRAWLRTVLVNQWRNLREKRSLPVAQADLDQLMSPGGVDLFEETEYRNRIVAHAARLMQAEFNDQTWQAFWNYVVLGQSAEETARRLKVSVNVIYLAKSRVVARLRQELHGLLDE